MKFHVLVWAAAAACGVASMAQSQSGRGSTFDPAGWRITGADSLETVEAGWLLPPGAQLSRAFVAGASIRANIQVEGMLSEEPAEVVALQIGRTTLVLTREGSSGVVRLVEGDGFAGVPLATLDLEERREGPVSIGLDAALSPDGSGLMLSLDGTTVERTLAGSGQQEIELALSAGIGAPLLITSLEVSESMAVSNAALSREGEDVANDATANTTFTRANEPHSNGVAPVDVGANSATVQSAVAAEEDSGAPQGGGGLEVFTPSSVRRHAPDANSSSQAQEVRS